MAKGDTRQSLDAMLVKPINKLTISRSGAAERRLAQRAALDRARALAETERAALDRACALAEAERATLVAEHASAAESGGHGGAGGVCRSRCTTLRKY